MKTVKMLVPESSADFPEFFSKTRSADEYNLVIRL